MIVIISVGIDMHQTDRSARKSLHWVRLLLLCFVRDMKLAWNYNNNPNLPLSDNKSQSTSRTGTGTGTCPAVAFYDNLSSQFSIRTSATNTSLYRGFKLERSGRRRLWRERARGKAWWILANKQSLAERVSKLGFIQLCPRIPPIVISLALSVGQ